MTTQTPKHENPFKKCTELGITAEERRALIDTFRRLEKGDFFNFDMNFWPCCIAGLSDIYGGANRPHTAYSKPLGNLFILPIYAYRFMQDQEAAAEAVKLFLHGSKKPWRDLCISRGMEVPAHNKC